MELKWTTILLLAALLSCGNALDWQGAGTWTQDNLTIIRSKIFSLSSSAPSSDYAVKAANISTELNTLWAEAWNVFIITYTDGKNYDSVLYGYGFRDHWFWFNGYKVNTGYVSFIIWKDYNCIAWTTYQNGSPQFSFESDLFQTMISKINNDGLRSARNVADVWLFAQDMQAGLPALDASLFQDKTVYTIVAAQNAAAKFYARFCAKQYLVAPYSGNKAGGNSEGTVFIMQMRDK